MPTRSTHLYDRQLSVLNIFCLHSEPLVMTDFSMLVVQQYLGWQLAGTPCSGSESQSANNDKETQWTQWSSTNKWPFQQHIFFSGSNTMSLSLINYSYAIYRTAWLPNCVFRGWRGSENKTENKMEDRNQHWTNTCQPFFLDWAVSFLLLCMRP